MNQVFRKLACYGLIAIAGVFLGHAANANNYKYLDCEQSSCEFFHTLKEDGSSNDTKEFRGRCIETDDSIGIKSDGVYSPTSQRCRSSSEYLVCGDSMNVTNYNTCTCTNLSSDQRSKVLISVKC